MHFAGYTLDRNWGKTSGAVCTALAALSDSATTKTIAASTLGDDMQMTDEPQQEAGTGKDVQPLLRKYMDSLEAGVRRRK